MHDKYLRLSHTLSKDTPSYGNRDKVLIRSNSSIAHGESANTSTWIFSNNHIGTHIDSSYHFCESGTKTVDIPVQDFFFNKVQLIDVPCAAAKLIGETDISNHSLHSDTELLLIRTGFEKFRNERRYWEDCPGIASSLADVLRSRFPQLRCIGFDFISITSWQYREEGRKSHQAFLCAGENKKAILAIEDMSLKTIDADKAIKWVVVAPLIVEDGNGGPVTVFALQNTDV